MSLKAISTAIEGVLILEPQVSGDERGFFLERFNQSKFNQVAGGDVRFVQDNHSRSARGVLRGLHFQLPPHGQGKLVWVSSGTVFDVVADIRRDSPTFGRWHGCELCDRDFRQLWIPSGLAHGFLVMSEFADFQYKTTEYYEPRAERTVRWDDPDLAIDWPLDGIAPILSAKDRNGLALKDLRQ